MKKCLIPIVKSNTTPESPTNPLSSQAKKCPFVLLFDLTPAQTSLIVFCLLFPEMKFIYFRCKVKLS